MKAIIKDDEIIKLSLTTGIEIGEIPAGVGLERLRWTGTELVDLGTLDIMYHHKQTGKLHARELPGTVKVTMKYKDRKKVDIDKKGNVTLKVKIDDDYIKLRKAEYPDIGDQLDAILMFLYGLPGLTTELIQVIEKVKKVKVKYKKPKKEKVDKDKDKPDKEKDK